MLGFATADRRSETVVIWLASRTDPTEASGMNTVVVNLADEHVLKEMHPLTHERVVIATPGSDLTGLPINSGYPTALFGEFIDAIRTHQHAIIEAMRSYMALRKGQKLVEPTFPARPQPPENWLETCQDRALELAGPVGRAWIDWLVSNGERLHRTTQPHTDRTPWIMPGELSRLELLALPPALAGKLCPEPAGPFPG